MATGGGAHLAGQPRFVRVQILDRVPVEPTPVPLDRLPHRSRMRGEQERGKVHSVRVERELGAHSRPVAEIGRRLGLLRPAERDRPCHEPGAGKQVSTAELSHRDLVLPEHSRSIHRTQGEAPGEGAPGRRRSALALLQLVQAASGAVSPS